MGRLTVELQHRIGSSIRYLGETINAYAQVLTCILLQRWFAPPRNALFDLWVCLDVLKTCSTVKGFTANRCSHQS